MRSGVLEELGVHFERERLGSRRGSDAGRVGELPHCAAR